jgi:hypothetical protein
MSLILRGYFDRGTSAHRTSLPTCRKSTPAISRRRWKTISQLEAKGREARSRTPTYRSNFSVEFLKTAGRRLPECRFSQGRVANVE